MKNSHQLRSVLVREFSAYFNSAIAYIFIIVFVLVGCGMYMAGFFLMGQPDMRAFFDLLPLLLCVFVPALTMRLWAEEKRGNTYELLLTFPMPTWKLVVGKFLAALMFYVVALAATLFIPLMLVSVGKPDVGPLLGGYLGAFLLGGFLIALGLFISALCMDQIVAFIVAMMTAFFILLLGWELVTGVMDGWIPGFGSALSNAIGMSHHLETLARGVVDLRDVLYFVLLAVVFLVLNTLAVEDRLRKGARMTFSVTAVMAVVVCLAANLLLKDMPMGRLDLTEGKIYTVSEAAHGILAGLASPVTVKYYVSASDKMPTAMKTLEQDVRDRLEELRARSNGKLVVRIIHLEAVQGQENQEDSLTGKLQRQGVQPISVRSINKDAMDVKLVYSAIALSYKDRDEEFIPRILPNMLSSLEYQLCAKIFRMMKDRKPVIALVAPYREKSLDPQLMEMLRRMGQGIPGNMREDKFQLLETSLTYEGYVVKRVRLTAEEPLPSDADAVFVVGPEELNDRQRYEVNRYLYKGGKVLIAAQGYMYDYRQEGMGTAIFPQKQRADVNGLIRNYGVAISDALLMDERHEMINISSPMPNGPFAYSIPVKVPMHVMVKDDTIDQKLSITGRLGAIFYLWGSSLDIDQAKLKSAGLNSTVLFTSGPKSWTSPYTGGMLRPEQVMSGAGSSTGLFPLGVMVEGKFPNAFEGKALPEWPKKEPAPGVPAPDPAVKEAPSGPAAEPVNPADSQSGILVVLGGSKMLEDEIIKENGSMNLMINAADALTLGGDLIKVRSREGLARYIRELSEGEKLLWRFLTVILVPVGFAVLGLVRVWLRRREKSEYLRSLR